MFVIKKGNLIISAVLLLTAFAFTLCFTSLLKKPPLETDAYAVKIVLDAGHGGIDGGVVGGMTRAKESELNLKVVKKLEKYFISAGFSVTLTRNSDAGLYGVATKNLKRTDMQKRKEIIEKVKPSVVISVHMNNYGLSSRRGAQVFYKKGDENGKLLANCVQGSFNSMKEAVRTCSALTGDYYILNCTNYPSIIAECGFLSNPEDEKLLTSEEFQDKIAYSLFAGAIDYLAQSSIVFF